MSYVYNTYTGSVNWMPGPAASAYVAAGSGLGWQGPFDDKAAVEKFYNDNKAKHPDWKAPTGFLGVIGNATEQVTGITPGSLDPLGVKNLNWQSWLIRIAEIMLGIVLIGVGIAKLGGTNTIGRIMKVTS